MTLRYQYPAKAEPVLPESLRPAAGNFNEWYQPASEPVRLSPQLVPQGEFGAAPPPHEIIVPVPTFFAVASPDPVRRSASIEYLSPPGELVLDKAQRTSIFDRIKGWYQVHENPVVRPPSIEHLSPPGELVLDNAQRPKAAVDPNFRLTQPPDPVRLPPPLQYQAIAQVVLPEALQAPVFSVASWYRQPSEPVLPPTQIVSGQSVFPFGLIEETITMDKWWKQPNDPVRPSEIRIAAFAPGGEAVRPQIVIGLPTFEQFGSISLPVDTGDHPDDAVYRFQGMMKSSSAVNSAQLRLFNVSDNVSVVVISTTSLTPVFQQSSPLGLPSGEKTYRVDIGGVLNGGKYSAAMAKLEVVAA